MVDVVLRRAWALHAGPREKDVALVAVGGYGRGELHPCSDIDVLVLLPKSEVAGDHEGIERFLDLPVGHRSRGRPQRAHDRRLPARERRRRQRRHHADRGAAAVGPGLPVPGDAPRARAGQRLVVAGFLRGQGGRAAGAAPPPPRHRVQPRAQRQDEPRAACATSRPSAGSRSGTSAPRPSTNSSTTASSPRRSCASCAPRRPSCGRSASRCT